MLLAHHHARLAALPTAPLVQQFVHDSRLDVIKYSAEWVPVGNLGSAPYRNADTTYCTYSANDTTIDLKFTSQGRADEWVSAHCAMENNVYYRLYLNGIFIGEGGAYGAAVHRPDLLTINSAGGSSFYRDPSEGFYTSPWFTVTPSAKRNHLKIVRQGAPSNAGSTTLYFDGFGLNLRGGPLPV